MLVKCDIEVNNRLTPTAFAHSHTRASRGAVCLCRKGEDPVKCKKKNFNVIIYTSKHKNGFNYRVRENINQVFSRFVDNGRVTISFKEPQHDICISKADPRDLKKLVHGIKLGFKGEDVPDLAEASLVPVREALENAKQEMKIKSRKDYPLSKSFPTSLTKLSANNCGLIRLDARILRLQNLCVLNLNENKLKELPESLENLKNLKELYLAKNCISSFPECLFRPVMRSCLLLLDLSSNQLERIPLEIGLFEKLTNLRMDNNSINNLPYSIGMLSSLRYLSLAKNNLKLLPYGFCKLNIDSLDLSGNPLDTDAANCIVSNSLEDVPTLIEIAARNVRDRSLIYSKGQLPSTIERYLDTAKICLCGKSCFGSHAVYIMMLDLGKIAHTITAEVRYAGRMSAPAEGYLCSQQCFHKWHGKPKRKKTVFMPMLEE